MSGRLKQAATTTIPSTAKITRSETTSASSAELHIDRDQKVTPNTLKCATLKPVYQIRLLHDATHLNQVNTQCDRASLIPGKVIRSSASRLASRASSRPFMLLDSSEVRMSPFSLDENTGWPRVWLVPLSCHTGGYLSSPSVWHLAHRPTSVSNSQSAGPSSKEAPPTSRAVSEVARNQYQLEIDR